MKIQLPLETWVDLLPFVPRRQLVKLFFQFEDRQLVYNLQFFLTKVGQITFDHLRIVPPKCNYNYAIEGPIVEVRKEMTAFYFAVLHMPTAKDLKTFLPEGPMPHNVKDFKSIHLSYFDQPVANFLRQFQREEEEGNSLLNNVNLWFSSHLSLSPHDDQNTLMQIIAQILPSIGNINSLHMYHFGLHDFEGVHNYAQTLTEMLTKTRILDSNDPHSTFSFREWLYTPRTDGKPRALRLPLSILNTAKFIGDIIKDFTKITRPVSFFVYVRVNETSRYSQWQDGFLDNASTNERLTIKTIRPPPMYRYMHNNVVQISRYPMDATKEWIEANEKEIKEWKFDKETSRCIRFERSLGW